MKKSLLISAALIAISIAAVAVTTFLPVTVIHKAAQIRATDTRLDAYVQEARSKGQTELIIPSPMVEYVTNVKSLHEALQYYTMVVATPVKKLTIAKEDGELRTWYTFDINESLTPKKYNPCDDCAPPGLLPRELLPLDPGQVLVAERGGSVTVDGVQLSMKPEFNFTLNERYLLFLEENESGVFARIMVGPDAIFKITPEQSFEDVTGKPHSLKKIVKERSRGKLKELKSAVKQS